MVLSQLFVLKMILRICVIHALVQYEMCGYWDIILSFACDLTREQLITKFIYAIYRMMVIITTALVILKTF